MCEALFEVMAPLIADDELVLEASFYGWCLEKPVVANQPELEKVRESSRRLPVSTC